MSKNIKVTDNNTVISHITPEGYKLIKCDPNLSLWTLQQLKLTEAGYVEKNAKEYLYLLDEHDPQKICKTELLGREGTGLAHISQLITESPNRNMSELCFAYCIDRGIPFVIAAIILYDYLECNDTFYEICHETTGGAVFYTKREWMPSRAVNMPPAQHIKGHANGKGSAPGIDDNYLLKTYADSGYSISSLAKTLKVSRPTATKLIDSLEIPSAVRRNPEKLKEYIEKIIDDAENSKHGLHNIPTGLKKNAGLPANKKTKQRIIGTYTEDEEEYTIDIPTYSFLEDESDEIG